MSTKARLAALEKRQAETGPQISFVVVDWGGDTIDFRDSTGKYVEMTRAEFEAKYPPGPGNPVFDWDGRQVINIRDEDSEDL